METNLRMVRCWITGAEIPMWDAMILNRERALRLRSELAQRIALLDRLIQDLAPNAGRGDRARFLGVKPDAPRLIGEVVASAYAASSGATDLFVAWLDVANAPRRRWIEGILSDRRVGPRFMNLRDGEWSHLYSIARQLRVGLNKQQTNLFRERRIDVCVARLFSGRDPTDLITVDRWLRSVEVAVLVDRASIPSEDRAVARDLLEVRGALAERRLSRTTAGAATPQVNSPESYDENDDQQPEFAVPGAKPARTGNR